MWTVTVPWNWTVEEVVQLFTTEALRECEPVSSLEYRYRKKRTLSPQRYRRWKKEGGVDLPWSISDIRVRLMVADDERKEVKTDVVL